MISPETWGVLGDVARNTSGLLAVCAAYFTIRVAYRTNQARAREAVRTIFATVFNGQLSMWIAIRNLNAHWHSKLF